MTEQVSNVPLVNAIGSETRCERVTSIMKSEIHEARIFASIPPACLNRIDVDTRTGIAEHKLLRSSILLKHHQFLKHDVVHWNGWSSSGLALGDENRSSKKVYVFPLQTENLAAPHARVKSDRDDGANVISSACELRKQFLLFICGNEPLSAPVLLQQAHPAHRI